MQFSVIVERVIALARQIREETDRTRRLAIEDELCSFLRALSAAEIYMLTTLMYLGRGDFGTAGLLDSYVDMSDTFASSDLAVGQMLDKTPLHKYLQAGLERLAESGIDVNTLLTSYLNTPLAVLNSSEGVELHVGPWYCDRCGQVIDQADKGILQWLTRMDGHRPLGRDLRIVHHMTASPLGRPNGCYPDEARELAVDSSTLCDEHLDRMVGWDGLVKLLALVEDGEFPASVVNRIIMRLFVPGYEQARRYFRKAIDTGVVDQGLRDDYFLQSQLRDIVANIPRLEG
jgi:hypothetical protein